MSLEITRREREGIVLLDLKGRITAGDEATAFRAAFEEVTGMPDAKLLLNMGEVDYIDSTGLGAMVMCSKRASNSKGVAKLVNVNRRAIELLVMTRIDTLFEVFSDEPALGAMLMSRLEAYKKQRTATETALQKRPSPGASNGELDAMGGFQ